MWKTRLVLVLGVVLVGRVALEYSAQAFSAAAGLLASTTLIGKQPDGQVLVATNQLIRPWEQSSPMAGRPVEIAIDAGLGLTAVLNTSSVHLLDTGTGVEVARAATKATSYTGLAFRPGATREIWVSETSREGPDAVAIVPIVDRKPGTIARISLQGHAVATGIAFSDAGTAWVALSNRNSVLVVDAENRKTRREIKTGMVPYGVVVSAKRKRVYVSNRGGRVPASGDTTAYSSTSAVKSHPVTGASTSGTVSIIDMESFAEQQIDVGLAPAGLALSPDEGTLAVANAHSDSVSFVDLESLKVSEVKVPAWPEGTFGSTPSAVAFSPDGKMLYVTAGGSNAVVALENEGRRWQLRGAIPTAWFPTALAVGPGGSLQVVNVKGMGSTRDAQGTHTARAFEGSVWRIPAPSRAQLTAGLREAKAANAPRFTAADGVDELSKLGIEHVFLLIKENRTYDQVFGDMGKGNGDPKLVMYGRDVTPNHHALAEQFVLLDNFYTGGAISFDGHQWLMQGFVSDYVERAFAASPRGYAWNMADALTVSPKGFFWQDPKRPVDVRLYGPFSLPATWDPATQRAVDINEDQLLSWPEYWKIYQQKSWKNVIAHRSGVPALQPYINERFPPSSMNVPDQIRAEIWLEELAEREKSGKMPNLLIFTMTSDHTMGTRPNFPTPRAMVADNDLAMGRIVESISKSRFWAKSLILVTEDDAQNGVDHVDGRRTICLAIGPRIRRGVLDSNHYNHASLIRTIQDVYRIKPQVRYAATARAMNSVFTTKADLQPYTALTPKVSLTEMNPALQGLSGQQLWAARQSLKIDANEVDEFPHDVMNRILWGAEKGWKMAYPAERIAKPRVERERD
ncbi:MAG: bifunctional YncE family protein/alkaline phosphatase family protein [Bryobacterales bacterium]|nr:bifunctional YncE family protein/alkaline phosphatase family protein [Bryobacterales bacterium]